jgi:dTDP-4-amino-4,6-dideoxygalactose transaminase
MAVTDDCSARLIRLPLWVGMDADMVDRVVAVLADAMALGPNVLNVQNLCE